MTVKLLTKHHLEFLSLKGGCTGSSESIMGGSRGGTGVWTPNPEKSQLEDLKVLKRTPDLLNNVKIGNSQLRLIIQTYFVLPYMGMVAILVKYHIYIY